MLSRAGFLFCLFVFMAGHSSGFPRGYYTVVAPGTARTETPYHVSVSLGDFQKSSWFNISFEDRGDITLHKTVEVQPRTTQLITFQMPKLSFGQGLLIVASFGGISSKYFADVSIEDVNYQVYIQTSKPMYKPGELVQFRVICIDQHTRPAVTEDVLDVLIHDEHLNLMKKFANIQLTQGVFKGQLQLADYTLLGKWSIRVLSNNTPRKEKSFQVARYVLPRFTVEIHTQSDVFVEDNDVKVLIKAKYAHQEPVEGTLAVNFTAVQAQRAVSHKAFHAEVSINGNHLITLNLKKDLQISGLNQRMVRTSQKLFSVKVHARVTDSVSNQIIEEEAYIAVHSSPHKIKLEVPKHFYPDDLVDVKVSVTDLQNNPVKGNGIPVKIYVQPAVGFMTMLDARETITLDGTGNGVASLNLTDLKEEEYRVSAEFDGYTSREETLRKNDFRLEVLTPSPEVGKEIIVELRSDAPIDHFVYEIVCRGNILQANHVNVPENARTHLIHIDTTHDMVPKISLYVHRFEANRLASSLKDIYIQKAFQNSIEITTEKEVRPGASVSLDVSTDEGSYVGLMGIDQRLLSNSQVKEDFTEQRVFGTLADYDAMNSNADLHPGSKAGLITLTNYYSPKESFGGAGGGAGGFTIVSRFDYDDIKPLSDDETQLRIRQLFTDGWLFDDIVSAPKGGWRLTATIPDAITSWAITGFSLNPRTGLSFTKKPTTLRTFQSFFVSMDVPTLLREGEIVEIPVHVFNYNNVHALTKLTVESQSENLVILESFSRDAQVAFKETSSMTIPAQGWLNLTFPIKALRPGLFNLTVRAISPLGIDALQKTLTVKSDGVPQVASKTYLVNFVEQSSQTDELMVNIPQNAVRGSEKVELSVVGDTFGPLMENVRSLVQVPYGNGKETTMQFISNLLVLKYLKVFNLKNPSLEKKAQLFLETGYQSLISLKHLDGSFSFFERPFETTGDTLQTVIVMWGMQQARNFIQTNYNVTRYLNSYLKPKQMSSGAFQSGVGMDDDVALTSLALLAFMEAEGDYEDVTSKGLAFLYNILDDLESETTSALCKYVLVVGRHEKYQDILKQLSSTPSNTRIHTSRQLLFEKPSTLHGYLKATAGSLLSILQSQTHPKQTMIPLVTALLSTGHSDKIPTHLMALDALIRIARDLHFGTRSLNIFYESDRGDSGKLRVSKRNLHVLQTVQLNSDARKISLRAEGKGFAVVSLKTSYNGPRENVTTSNYHTNVTVLERVREFVSLEVCVSTRHASGTPEFTAVEVNLPSGYTALEDQNDSPFNSNFELRETRRWLDSHTIDTSSKLRLFKVDSDGVSVHAVLKGVDQSRSCFRIAALRAFKVLNAGVVSIVAYDVYDEDQKSTSFFELQELDSTKDTR